MKAQLGGDHYRHPHPHRSPSCRISMRVSISGRRGHDIRYVYSSPVVHKSTCILHPNRFPSRGKTQSLRITHTHTHTHKFYFEITHERGVKQKRMRPAACLLKSWIDPSADKISGHSSFMQKSSLIQPISVYTQKNPTPSSKRTIIPIVVGYSLVPGPGRAITRVPLFALMPP